MAPRTDISIFIPSQFYFDASSRLLCRPNLFIGPVRDSTIMLQRSGALHKKNFNSATFQKRGVDFLPLPPWTILTLLGRIGGAIDCAAQMLGRLRNLWARPASASPPSVPFGERVYAIGDIHGRIDLFDQLIEQIEKDDEHRMLAETTVVLLGDLIDRGPDSAGVLMRARDWSRQRRVKFIMGNHEEMLLESRTNLAALDGFLRFGGLETIESYGVDLRTGAITDIEQLQCLMNAAIPQADFDFIEHFDPTVRLGDYLFVHAGIRPEVPIAEQIEQECRWIREPFLSHKGDFGAFVIHGHTISELPDVCSNRIGIDTGAYLHGTLTALGLEGTDRWFLQARDHQLPEGLNIAA
ncbi:metallophosphoesterase family protein [Novosphingobium sp.]|uniref:metallophosphoesterase family protein n=1 Tax=Novosphingobium sp. TaxID=1874826 RepID=UPI002FDB54F8